MTTAENTQMTGATPSQDRPEWMQHVARYVKQMNYGQITLTIHQGNVVEIQRTERTRIPSRKGGD
ncbi:MAG: YezD family protein [Puniceicoccaceae bacterium]